MFLPVTAEEMYEREIWQPDFVLVSADAYVDHPSFGHALISRLVEAEGFSVCVLAQPQTDEDFTRFGEPKKAFLVSGGVVDSMVDNYTVAKRRRTRDVYSEGGEAGRRPDRATSVYCRALKRLYPGVPVIAGGIEASLRRLSHYDYWSDSVMRSILCDSGADLVIYGMGENPILDLMKLARKNVPLGKVRDVRGTAYLTDVPSAPAEVREAIAGGKTGYVTLPSHARVCADKKLYAKAFMLAYDNTDPFSASPLIQKQDETRYVVVNRPALPLTEEQMDRVYALPYERRPHPSYARGVPAIEEVEWSVTAHRGCYGGCNFCALTYHQGRIVQARSDDSIVSEVERLASSAGFKGYIHDIGGPSANFHEPACEKQLTSGACRGKSCIGSKMCPALRVSHAKYLGVLRRARAVKGVKKVFVRSGIRYDYLMADPDRTFFNELVKHHISGQLKVAPEHCCDAVLSLMNKPAFEQYLRFADEFAALTAKHGLKQYLVPYLISSHPGCTLSGAIELTEYLMKIGYMPEQVQDFYPTPSTLSTTMYYCEFDPRDGKEVYVAKSPEDKAAQRALMQYRIKENRPVIKRALARAGRRDLIYKWFKER